MIQLVEPVLRDEGLELVDAECRREAAGKVVRVLVDQEGGVDLATLSRLSRELSDLFDGIEPIAGPYTLEVSSPGINRPLRTAEHFARYVGKRVRVRTSEPIDGQRTFLGVLEDVGGEGIRLILDGGSVVNLSFDEIERANYQHEFSASDFGRGSTGSSRRGRRQRTRN